MQIQIGKKTLIRNELKNSEKKGTKRKQVYRSHKN